VCYQIRAALLSDNKNKTKQKTRRQTLRHNYSATGSHFDTAADDSHLTMIVCSGKTKQNGLFDLRNDRQFFFYGAEIYERISDGGFSFFFCGCWRLI